MRMDYNNNEGYTSFKDEIDIIKILKQLFRVKNIIIMAVAGILTGVITFSYSVFVLPELYTSDVSLYVNNSAVKYNSYDIVDMTSLVTSRNLADSYVIILMNNAVMEQIGDGLLDIYSEDELSEYFPIDEKKGNKYIKGKYIKSCFNIAPVDETEILQITVTTKNPELSTNMCNEMAKVAPRYLPTIANGGSIEPIGVASVPDGKSYPNNRQNAVKGGFAGVFAVLLIMIAKILMDTKIRNAESFKEKFDCPVLGEIPFIEVIGKKDKFSIKGKQSGVVDDSFQTNEAFNALCNNLIVTMSMNDEKVVVVSSPEMSDGKSTVSLRLARAMANMGNKVLLMDLDLRRPSIHKKVDASNKKGFTTLLSKPNDFNLYLHKDNTDGLDILFSGGVSPNPSEMLASKRTKNILEKYEDIYDFIIIDSPPVNVVPDTCIISKLTAGIVVVVRANETHFDDFSHAAENIAIAGTNIIGVVINGVEEYASKHGKRYGRDSYSYNYVYAEDNDEKKKA